MSVKVETWLWLCEQYEPATTTSIAEAMGVSRATAGRRMLRICNEGSAVNLSPGTGGGASLWVALDVEPWSKRAETAALVAEVSLGETVDETAERLAVMPSQVRYARALAKASEIVAA